MDKGEDALGRYSIMETDDKIIIKKLNKLTSVEPKIMIHRLLKRDYKMIKLISKYRWKYLTIIKMEEDQI